ncbi:phosphatase 2C-like domain-containing protein [Mycena alexandri]|uniref:Phosphatase 2C-like domain-containing protein n=1 Tax=Mycena alexandri TaxID=1745969 RepID=A0AAD6SPC2_9AGAR|nr:phosphatase 2C-like domain-containing protein [Mycena alexandri]
MNSGKIHEAIQTFAGVQIASVQYQPTDRSIEDRFSVTLSPTASGHGGAATAEHISNILPPALLECSPEEHTRVFEATDKSMLDAFKIDHPPFRFHIPGMQVNYANAGYCRSLVFHSQDSEDTEPLQQTADLNAKSQSEQERLKREHPDEELLAALRETYEHPRFLVSFGVNNWQHKKYVDALSSIDRNGGKVPLNVQYESYFYGYRTPPYLVATPNVGVMRLSRDSVIVCGSDGLFDLVTNEVVAQTVRLGIRDGVGNLAAHLLDSVIPLGIGDDVTILVLIFT